MIESLTLVGYSQITTKSFSVIATKCVLLSSLTVSNNKYITNQSIQQIAINCKHITAWDLSQCFLLDSFCLVYIRINSSNLRVLRFATVHQHDERFLVGVSNVRSVKVC